MSPVERLVLMLAALVGFFGLSLVGAVVWPAAAQEHHPPEDQAAHDKFYASWGMPDHVEWKSCCNKQDCYPTEFKRVGAHWYARRREDGELVRIPPEKFEHNRRVEAGAPNDSPDGRNHVCMAKPTAGPTVYCAILGGGG